MSSVALNFGVSFILLEFNAKPKSTSISSSLAHHKEPIFSHNFVLLALANLFTFGSFNVLLATLPIYLKTVGGKESEIGLVLGVFAITALLVRPFVGIAGDMWGKKKFMIIGGIAMAMSPLLYIVSNSVLPMIGVRLFQGLAFGIISTALGALIADIVPASRRGEAVGYFGMSNNIAMAAGPALGIVVMQSWGFTNLFFVSASIGLLSVIFSLPVNEPARQPRPTSVTRPPLVVRSALLPASVLFCYALTFGSVVTFLPLFAVTRGLSNPGLFFTVQALVVLALRSFTGRLSDRIGRKTVALPGLMFCTISLILISQVSSTTMFLVAAALYALAFSCIQPPMTAMVIDRVKPEIRGAAMGTFISAMDAGIGGGAFLWGVVAGLTGYSRMYLIASLVPVLAIVLFLCVSRVKKKEATSQTQLSGSSEYN